MIAAFSEYGASKPRCDLLSLSLSVLESISHNVTDRQRCGIDLINNKM